jgi:tetratricopeptide (TPR) repeat protein
MRRFILFSILALFLNGISPMVARSIEVPPNQVYKGYELVQDWRISEAETLTQSLLEQFPQSGDVRFLQAQVEFFKGNYEYAWKILKPVEDKHDSVQDFKSLANETRQAAANFISRESEHFIFRFEKGPDEILVHYAEEVLERSYQVLGDLLDYFPKEKVRVEIYPSREPLSRVSPLTRKDIITSGTVALCKYNRIMLISPASLVRGYHWMDTLSHEYTHYLLTKKSHNKLPLWIHEGIAKHVEGKWRQAEDFLSPLMKTVLAAGLANDYLISLDAMMPSLAKLKNQEDVQLAYAEVASMVDFMIREKGASVLAALLDDLANGKDFESALTAQLGMDLTTFQEKWKGFMKQQNLKTIPGLKALKTRFKTDRSSEEDKKDYQEVGAQRTQDLTFLGDILKSRNQYKAAIIEYEKAFEESDIESPILYNKLAGTYLTLQNYEQAELNLKKSLQHYPDFHTTLVNIGEMYLETERTLEAKDYFERAVRINPFNPFVHLRLIKIYDILKMEKEKNLQKKLYKYLENRPG